MLWFDLELRAAKISAASSSDWRRPSLDKAFVVIYVIGGAKTRELEKFAYKMGLIEVSEINGKVRPIDRGIVLDESPGLLKPLNPAEQLTTFWSISISLPPSAGSSRLTACHFELCHRF